MLLLFYIFSSTKNPPDGGFLDDWKGVQPFFDTSVRMS
jgi:hypothetical protein